MSDFFSTMMDTWVPQAMSYPLVLVVAALLAVAAAWGAVSSKSSLLRVVLYPIVVFVATILVVALAMYGLDLVGVRFW